MTITNLTPREQQAIEFASVRYTWPGATPIEGLELNTAYQVEQYAKEMDKDAYEKSYQDFQTLPPAKQAEIKADIEASKPVIEQKPPGGGEPAPKKVNR